MLVALMIARVKVVLQNIPKYLDLYHMVLMLVLVYLWFIQPINIVHTYMLVKIMDLLL